MRNAVRPQQDRKCPAAACFSLWKIAASLAYGSSVIRLRAPFSAGKMKKKKADRNFEKNGRNPLTERRSFAIM